MKRSRDEDRETKASQKKLAALPKSDKSALKSKSPTSSTRPVANIITSDPSKAAKSGKTSESMDGKGKKSSKDNKAIKTSSSKGDAIGKDRKKKFGESDPDLGDFDIDIDAIFGEIKDKKLARQMEEKEEEERQRVSAPTCIPHLYSFNSQITSFYIYYPFMIITMFITNAGGTRTQRKV